MSLVKQLRLEMQNKGGTETETLIATSLSLWFNCLKSEHVSLNLGPNAPLVIWLLLSSMFRVVGFWALGFSLRLATPQLSFPV